MKISDDLPEWQKKLFDKRFELLQQHPDLVTPLDDFLKEMEEGAIDEENE